MYSIQIVAESETSHPDEGVLEALIAAKSLAANSLMLMLSKPIPSEPQVKLSSCPNLAWKVIRNLKLNPLLFQLKLHQNELW